MSDEFTRGFLEGVEVAARIFRNHIGATRQECPRCCPPDADVSQQATRDQGCPAERGRPEMPLSGPESPADASHLVTESDSGGSEYPADHPQPMTVWTPPTVGFYRVPEETD